MKFEEMKALMQLFDASKINKMNVEVGDFKLLLEKENTNVIPMETSVRQEEKMECATKTINSPIVGVFYNRRSPESEPFVSVGSEVKKGDCLCIIEAMKVMNEIVANEDGTILEVLVQNEDLVEFDQPLFKIG